VVIGASISLAVAVAAYAVFPRIRNLE
jgi:hypothetical protein